MLSFSQFLRESTDCMMCPYCKTPKHKVNEAANKTPFDHNTVVYHGTARNFKEFGTAKRHPSTPADEAPGHFFTTDGNSAYSHAARAARLEGGKARVVRANLHFQNPKDVTKEVKKHQKSGLTFGQAKRKAYAGVDRTKHDGILFHGNSANPPEYVAFHHSTIKQLTETTQFNRWVKKQYPLPQHHHTIPQTGQVPFIKTDDGNIHPGTSDDYSHVKLAQRLGIHPTRISHGGFLYNGVETDTHSPNVESWVQQETAKARIAHRRKLTTKK